MEGKRKGEKEEEGEKGRGKHDTEKKTKRRENGRRLEGFQKINLSECSTAQVKQHLFHRGGFFVSLPPSSKLVKVS